MLKATANNVSVKAQWYAVLLRDEMDRLAAKYRRVFLGQRECPGCGDFAPNYPQECDDCRRFPTVIHWQDGTAWEDDISDVDEPGDIGDLYDVAVRG